MEVAVAAVIAYRFGPRQPLVLPVEFVAGCQSICAFVMECSAGGGGNGHGFRL